MRRIRLTKNKLKLTLGESTTTTMTDVYDKDYQEEQYSSNRQEQPNSYRKVFPISNTDIGIYKGKLLFFKMVEFKLIFLIN